MNEPIIDNMMIGLDREISMFDMNEKKTERGKLGPGDGSAARDGYFFCEAGSWLLRNCDKTDSVES